MQSVRQALLAISARKAMGVDALRSSDVARLPDVAVQQWVDMLQRIEKDLVWPQVLTTILALLPKSRGGDAR